MKAAVLERRGLDGLTWRDFPDPAPAAGESVLKVAASSVNRVDLYMRDNGGGITHTLPQVMGVEAAGEVVEAAPGSGLKPGMKAVLFSEAFCGKCRYYLAGNQPLCENVKIMGEHRNGGFADYIAMPSSCFFPPPRRCGSGGRRISLQTGNCSGNSRNPAPKYGIRLKKLRYSSGFFDNSLTS
jgi:D-arabinose 1-dehydrogenase-like Zn-dependent alcohol dehydrogenase